MNEQDQLTCERTNTLKIDKENLYGLFNQSVKDRQENNRQVLQSVFPTPTHDTAYRKARDLPLEEEVNVDQSQRTVIVNKGLDWWKSAILTTLMAIIAIGFYWTGRMAVEKKMPVMDGAGMTDANTHLRLRIADPD